MTVDPLALPERDLLDAWGARVRADREQVDRVREVEDGTDFYAPVASAFRANPFREDDASLNQLLELVRA